MYAIVEIAGQQFKVSKDLKVYVNRLEGKEGDAISFGKVLLLDDNGTITLGAPAIDGASVEAQVIKHLQGDKVIVFKKKRRKGYKKKNGHRQALTQIQISGISLGAKTRGGAELSAAKAAAPKAEKAAAPKAEKAAKADDLALVEGIGPKAAEALTAAGIATFAQLAKASEKKIREILEAGENLSHLDPETWAAQAKMAAEGKMDELKQWQDELKGGKSVE